LCFVIIQQVIAQLSKPPFCLRNAKGFDRTYARTISKNVKVGKV